MTGEEAAGSGYITYEKRHMAIVESGVRAIKDILFSDDNAEKARIVFCLERYLDPYYGNRLPDQDAVLAVLQDCLFQPNPASLKEDILHLLSMYATCPLAILEKRCHELDAALQPEARRILSEP